MMLGTTFHETQNPRSRAISTISRERRLGLFPLMLILTLGSLMAEGLVLQDAQAAGLNADNVCSKQGSFRQFIKNSNAITGLNKSWFLIPGV